MLVLIRRTGQTFMINDNVEITVISANRNFVRIGINAPKDISIDREEFRNSKKQSIEFRKNEDKL